MKWSLTKSSCRVAATEAPASVTTLDLTGLKCPLPVLKVRRQVSQMVNGERIVVMADDPAAPLDFEHFCNIGGHELVETLSEGEIFTFYICVGNSPTA